MREVNFESACEQLASSECVHRVEFSGGELILSSKDGETLCTAIVDGFALEFDLANEPSCVSP